jgi:hypothetical protein
VRSVGLIGGLGGGAASVEASLDRERIRRRRPFGGMDGPERTGGVDRAAGRVGSVRPATVVTPAHRPATPRRPAASVTAAAKHREKVEIIVQAVVGGPYRSTVGR